MKMIEFKDVATACKGKINALNGIDLALLKLESPGFQNLAMEN